MQYTRIPVRTRIKEHLLAKGFTQTDLAEALGVSPMQVSRWATGKAEPNSVTRARICNALGVEPMQLYYIESEIDESTT
jgi:transcriptional regulator with XRE-family HTH domain